MKYLGIFIVIMLLAGCAIWAPGQDPRGERLVSNAIQVLAALNKYVAENTNHPDSLDGLVPKYIKALPEEPSMLYKADEGSLFFTYSPSWPQQGHVACSGKIGQKRFGCNGYI